jgi:hypothetical protein
MMSARPNHPQPNSQRHESGPSINLLSRIKNESNADLISLLLVHIGQLKRVLAGLSFLNSDEESN